jgi:acyl carrier protein
VLDDPSLEIAAGSTPDEVPGWDSFQHIALLVEAECRFGVLFEPEEVAALTSVGRLACAIAGKRHVPSLSNAPV